MTLPFLCMFARWWKIDQSTVKKRAPASIVTPINILRYMYLPPKGNWRWEKVRLIIVHGYIMNSPFGLGQCLPKLAVTERIHPFFASNTSIAAQTRGHSSHGDHYGRPRSRTQKTKETVEQLWPPTLPPMLSTYSSPLVTEKKFDTEPSTSHRTSSRCCKRLYQDQWRSAFIRSRESKAHVIHSSTIRANIFFKLCRWLHYCEVTISNKEWQ